MGGKTYYKDWWRNTNTKTKKAKHKKPVYKIINKFKRLDSEIVLSLDNDCLSHFISSAAKLNPSEVSGFAWVDDNGKIVSVHTNSDDLLTRNSGGSAEYGTAEIVMHCMMNDIPYPNLQWHTHPEFSPYWSGTDLRDQDDLMLQLTTEPEGEFHFLVFNGGMQWNIRKYSWNGSDFWQEDGTVELMGVKMSPVTYTSKSYLSEGGGYWSLPTADGWREWRTLSSNYWGSPPPRISGGNADDDLILLDRWEEDAYMLGEEGEERVDYDRLFKMFQVGRYDYATLFDCIDSHFPGSYYKVLRDKSSWDDIEEYLSMFKKETMNNARSDDNRKNVNNDVPTE